MKKEEITKIIIIILIVILAIIVIFKLFGKSKDNNNNNNKIMDSGTIVEENSDNKIIDSETIVEENRDKVFTIKGTEKNAIVKDGIEISEIKVLKTEYEYEISIRIKNTLVKDIDSLYITLDLLDDSGKVATTTSFTIDEKLESNKETVITTYSAIEENDLNITNVRIVSLEKNYKEAMENQLKNMIVEH